jgi:hypothetical protein
MVQNIADITKGIQDYLVAPLNAFGMGGFLFTVQGEALEQLSSDITDHYTEDNKAVQDHIAKRPRRIVLKGYVGELSHDIEPANQQALQVITQKLTTLTPYLPVLSSAAIQLQEAFQAPTQSQLTLSDTADIYGLVKNSLAAFGNQSKQQNAFNYFRTLWEQGVLMGIQTPWEFLTNMAIDNVVSIQGEETIFMTDFAVSFKQLRFAETQTLAFTTGNTQKQGAAEIQCTPELPLGIVPGQTLPLVTLPGAQSLITGGASFMTNPVMRGQFQLGGGS